MNYSADEYSLKEREEKFFKKLQEKQGDGIIVIGKFKNHKTPIEVLVRKCGHSWFSTPNSLLSGAGCRTCAILATAAKRTIHIDIILKDLNDIHGQAYDYLGLENYKNTRSKILIRHKVCGFLFPQTVDAHKRGSGCPQCFGTIKNSINKILEDFRKIHGNDFEYPGILDYKNRNEPILMTHVNCGYTFLRTPANHLLGTGCSKCSDCYHRTQQEMEKAFIEIHGDKFEYPGMNDYVNNKTPILMRHKICGYVFLRSPSNHLVGQECLKCCGKLPKTPEEVLANFRKVHGDDYEYPEISMYKGMRRKMLIIHKKCGRSFYQTPDKHFREEQGCKACSIKISKLERKWLKKLNIPDDKEHRQVRFKIAGKSFSVDGFDPESKTCYEFLGDFYHGNPKVYNYDDYNNHCQTTFGELFHATIDRLNLLKSMGMEIFYVWENDFKSGIIKSTGLM